MISNGGSSSSSNSNNGSQIVVMRFIFPFVAHMWLWMCEIVLCSFDSFCFFLLIRQKFICSTSNARTTWYVSLSSWALTARVRHSHDFWIKIVRVAVFSLSLSVPHPFSRAIHRSSSFHARRASIVSSIHVQVHCTHTHPRASNTSTPLKWRCCMFDKATLVYCYYFNWLWVGAGELACTWFDTWSISISVWTMKVGCCCWCRFN